MTRCAAAFIRYTAYIAFAVAAVIFWCIFALVILGMMPFPYERACDPYCPEPTFWEQAAGFLGAVLALPTTVLAFVFYRKWIRKRLGYGDE